MYRHILLSLSLSISLSLSLSLALSRSLYLSLCIYIYIHVYIFYVYLQAYACLYTHLYLCLDLYLILFDWMIDWLIDWFTYLLALTTYLLAMLCNIFFVFVCVYMWIYFLTPCFSPQARSRPKLLGPGQGGVTELPPRLVGHPCSRMALSAQASLPVTGARENAHTARKNSVYSVNPSKLKDCKVRTALPCCAVKLSGPQTQSTACLSSGY